MYEVGTCLIEELSVGDRFYLIKLSPDDDDWREHMKEYKEIGDVPYKLDGKVLIVDKMFRPRYVRYTRVGGEGNLRCGAIVIKL